MISVLVVLLAGVAPAVVFDLARRHGHGQWGRDTSATVRRHHDFLDALAELTPR